MSALQEQFAAQFGDGNASNILAAAIEHNNGVHGNPGSDIFRWALCISIGYECWSEPGYAEYHGIDVDAEAVREWIKTHADLGNHDGDVDYLAAMGGAYDEYVTEASA